VIGWQSSTHVSSKGGCGGCAGWCCWVRIPAILNHKWEGLWCAFRASEVVVVGWQSPPLVFQAREVGAAGCESPLSLAFRVREVVVVGKNPLRHSNREWEGGSWQAKPPTRISSEGGGGDGRECPLSLKLRVGGWLWAGKAPNLQFERGRWW